MQIRPATPADAEAICRVHVASIQGLCTRDYTPQQIQSWTSFKRPDAYRQYMADGETFYLALTDSGEVTGIASFFRDRLTTLYVHPAHTRQGIGRSLLAAVESELRRRGQSTIQLHATLTSVPFYQKHGYQPHEPRLFRLPDGVELPCVRMTKSLLPALTIRPATPADATRIHQIHTDSIRTLCAADYTPEQIDSWTRFRSPDDYRRALESGETNWLAIFGDHAIAGYATYADGELTALFVDPAHARHGAGRLLLSTAEHHARSLGLPALTLQSTLTSRPFYERHGYTATTPESFTLPDGVPLPCIRMTKPLEAAPDPADLLARAINEPVAIVPYDPAWPSRFEAERARLAALFPDLRLEHIGSTAVPGMPAKPIIDCLATVPSMAAADQLVDLLCANGYTTSATYNQSLGDRRWLMRHSDGHRTHHLHLVLPGSVHLTECLRFRDALRSDAELARRYAELKHALARELGTDREAYTAAKTAFVAAALRAAD